MIIVGKSKKGGTTDRQAELVQLAVNDLREKTEGSKITALALFSDEIAVYAIGAIDKVSDDSKETKKKRGK